MKKLFAIVLIFFTLGLVSFATWNLFHGHLEAAFMPFPFLLILYLFLKTGDK